MLFAGRLTLKKCQQSSLQKHCKGHDLDTSRGAMGMVQQGELKPNARRRSWGAWAGSVLRAQSWAGVF